MLEYLNRLVLSMKNEHLSVHLVQVGFISRWKFESCI